MHKRVTSEELAGLLTTITEQLRSTLKITGLTSYASGFSEASIFAAVIAALACALTYRYCVSRIPRSSAVYRARLFLSSRLTVRIPFSVAKWDPRLARGRDNVGI
jgi:hypothetical protein